MPRPELTLVIPIYNEQEVLPQLDVRVHELLGKLALEAEVVFVDDGSKDRSLQLLRAMAEKEPRYRVASFSRNFGHQRAITCGMDLARGKAVVVMDADLQDPPEVILQMVARWREGFDVVYGRRRSREGETAFKLLTAKIFYRLFAAMIPIEVPLDTGDFRLMSRRVVQTLRGLRESHRFVRGLVAWVGFKQTAVEYDRAARAAGETKYPLRKMLAFAADGIASFSVMPLRAATYLGVLVGLGSILYGISAVVAFFAGKNVQGWTTTVVLVSFLFSVQFLMLGVLGEYVGRIYEQLKLRPLYIVAERINFGRKTSAKLKAPEPPPPPPELALKEPDTRPEGPAAPAARKEHTFPPPVVAPAPAPAPIVVPTPSSLVPSPAAPSPAVPTPSVPPPSVTPSRRPPPALPSAKPPAIPGAKPPALPKGPDGTK